MRVAVVGGGIVGLCCAVSLLERGGTPTVYEPLPLMSARSAGDSRIFRLAHEQPALVECARRSLDVLRTWERRTGAPLVIPTGVAVTGANAGSWAAGMRAAGAVHEWHQESRELALPMPDRPEPTLVDPAGGVLRLDLLRQFLTAEVGAVVRRDRVLHLEPGARTVDVVGTGGRDPYDVVVLAAGEGTAPLAGEAGLELPDALAHHVRFTFPMRDRAARHPAWIADVAGLATYQHMNAPGQWSVGGHLDPELVRWEIGADAAREVSRSVVVPWVRENLDFVVPTVVDDVHCSINPELGDGFHVAREGAVLAVHGENLAKLAPALGRLLADAAESGETPPSVS